ncbi:MAG: beta-ketoacyl synthase N-terminal-like domain-containing protein, partial [Enterobacteriaceae bacterium]
MLDAYIYSGLRTPFGRRAGALSAIRPDDLVAGLIKQLVADSPFDPLEIEDVILGCVSQAGEDSRNVARYALLLAGLPVTMPGQTVNRLCSSSLAAALTAAWAISSGEGSLFLAGGVESMTRAPFVVGKSEHAFDRTFQVFDSSIGSRFPNPHIIEQFGDDTMTQTADNVAVEFAISRDACDAFALRSQQKYAAAKASGFFDDEIMP